MDANVVDAGTVKLSGRSRGSKYDPLIEKANTLKKGQMLLLNLEDGETAETVSRRLRNYLGRHNKAVAATGNGTKLGIREVEGGKQLAIIPRD